MTWHRYLAVGALMTGALGNVSGCAAPLESLAGSSEGTGTLAGALSLTVIEEGSGHRVSGAVVRVYTRDGAFIGEGTTQSDGTLEFTHAALTGNIAIDVSSGGRAQRMEGVQSAEVVLALPMPSTHARVMGTVTGLPASAERATEVGVGLLVTLMRTRSLDAVAPSVCVTSAEGSCAFESLIPQGGTAPTVATVSDGSGAIAFLFGQVSASSAIVSESLPVRELGLRLPADDTGLAGVIGVPGLALEGQLVLLPQAQSSAAMLRVPSVSDHPTLSEASYWVLVEGHPRMGSELDLRARSVLFQRGLGATSTAAWDAWLAIPEPRVEGTRVSFAAVDGADVYAVDFIDAEGALLGATWVLAGAGNIAVTRPESIDEARIQRIRVRAIDTVFAPTVAGFDAAAIELGAQRFSEREWVR